MDCRYIIEMQDGTTRIMVLNPRQILIDNGQDPATVEQLTDDQKLQMAIDESQKMPDSNLVAGVHQCLASALPSREFRSAWRVVNGAVVEDKDACKTELQNQIIAKQKELFDKLSFSKLYNADEAAVIQTELDRLQALKSDARATSDDVETLRTVCKEI